MNAMGIRQIVLVRHGQYHANQSHPLYGHLTRLGQVQSEHAAIALRDHPPDLLESSALPRAVETADILAEVMSEVPRHRSRDLNECFPCVPRTHYRQIPELAAWTDEHLRAATVLDPALGGWIQRRFHEVTDIPIELARAEAALRRLCRPWRRRSVRREVVVCHGNLIRYIACRAMGIPGDHWLGLTIHNAGLTRLLVDRDGAWSLVSFNEVGHLPEELRTVG